MKHLLHEFQSYELYLLPEWNLTYNIVPKITRTIDSLKKKKKENREHSTCSVESKAKGKKKGEK